MHLCQDPQRDTRYRSTAFDNTVSTTRVLSASCESEGDENRDPTPDPIRLPFLVAATVLLYRNHVMTRNLPRGGTALFARRL